MSEKTEKETQSKAEQSVSDEKLVVEEIKESEGDAQSAPVVEDENESVIEVEDFKQQLSSANDRYLRLMAEFDNYKKRTSREYERLVESANEKLMVDMIDVRENFERAIATGESGADFQNFFEGTKLIFNKFEKALEKNGLEYFAQPGDVFDPQIHDALMKTAHQEIPEDHIASVYEKGYLLKGKVIKHAKVIVSSGKPAEENA
jgi:molecular chaperone GrpE